MELSDIPWDDKKTFELLATGKTVGLFQIESGFAAGVVKKIGPNSLDELAAIQALLRPGSIDSGSDKAFAERKRSGSRTPTIHPDINAGLEPTLRDTYGLMVYQEQVMQTLSVVTGWDTAEADDVFNALRKKDFAKMDRARPRFMEAGRRKGYSEASLEALWAVVVPFADYSFNKAHSYGYAYICYWTAYLKANHPKEFMTALMTSAKNEDIPRYLVEIDRMGITLLPPDINESGMGFTCTKKGIRYGLGAIKGIGEPISKAIVAGRPFRSLDGFFRSVDPKVLNKRALEALVRSGCFDSLWSSREQLLVDATDIAALALRSRGSRGTGQSTLSRTRYIPRSAEAGAAQKDSECRAAWERELLGAEITRPRIVLTATRLLSETEWLWMRGVLTGAKPSQEVTLNFGSVKMDLPKTTYNEGLRNSLALLGVQTLEE